ncbi:MAG TPA: hypothetical protein VF743_00710 [Acidimicrobiales bacterium]
MAFIDAIPEHEAGPELAALYEADRCGKGYVANHTRAFSHRPRVLQAWQELNAAVRAGMDGRRYELATVAAARRLRSSYCTVAHGKVLLEEFVDAEHLCDIVSDHRSAGLDAVDVAVMDLADKVAADATTVEQADVDRLKDLGCTDADVLDVILAAAARSFFSKVLDATGSLPDVAYHALGRDLLATLTVGRPVEQA